MKGESSRGSVGYELYSAGRGEARKEKVLHERRKEVKGKGSRKGEET